MKNRWAMLLAVLLIPVWATAQNAANSSFQIKGILLDSLTKEGEPYATIKIVNLKSATPFPKCYLHKEKWTFDS